LFWALNVSWMAWRSMTIFLVTVSLFKPIHQYNHLAWQCTNFFWNFFTLMAWLNIACCSALIFCYLFHKNFSFSSSEWHKWSSSSGTKLFTRLLN
jgi:hypothetical protein